MIINLSTSDLFVLLSFIIVIYFFWLYVVMVLKERTDILQQEKRVLGEYENLQKEVKKAQKQNTKELIDISVMHKYKDLLETKGSNFNDNDIWNAMQEGEDEYLYFRNSIKKEMVRSRSLYKDLNIQNKGDEKKVDKDDIS